MTTRAPVFRDVVVFQFKLFGAVGPDGPAQGPSGMDVILEDIEEMVRDPERREEARARPQELLERLRHTGGTGSESNGNSGS